MAKTLHLSMADRIGDALFTALLSVGVKIGTISLLIVRGRKSGQPHTIPVLVVEQDSHRFLVAPYGVVQWVQNIRAAGRATLTRSRRSETICVTELEAKAAAPILKNYLSMATAARPYFDATKDSSLQAFEHEAARHPVFQITTVGDPTRPEHTMKEITEEGNMKSYTPVTGAPLMPKPTFLQWLYRGHRPNWIAKLLNRISAVVASTGITANYMETLEVIGRKSGRIIALPVVVAIVDGQRYLVSMLGDSAQWVLNVRAAGGKAVMHSGRRNAVHLEEVPTDRRAPILKAYLKGAPGARPHIPVDKDAPLVDFEKIAADYPVFQIVSNQDVNL